MYSCIQLGQGYHVYVASALHPARSGLPCVRRECNLFVLDSRPGGTTELHPYPKLGLVCASAAQCTELASTSMGGRGSCEVGGSCAHSAAWLGVVTCALRGEPGAQRGICIPRRVGVIDARMISCRCRRGRWASAHVPRWARFTGKTSLGLHRP